MSSILRDGSLVDLSREPKPTGNAEARVSAFLMPFGFRVNYCARYLATAIFPTASPVSPATTILPSA